MSQPVEARTSGATEVNEPIIEEIIELARKKVEPDTWCVDISFGGVQWVSGKSVGVSVTLEVWHPGCDSATKFYAPDLLALRDKLKAMKEGKQDA